MIEKREIWFRGKSSATKEWVYGYFYKKKFYRSDAALCSYISIPHPGRNNLSSDDFLVIPETVGQFTGMFDGTKWEQLTKEEQSEWRKKHTIDEWNGRMIFEGDIVELNIKGHTTICKVAWADNVAQFQLWQTNTIPHTPTVLNFGNYDCEVIGNIYDNPKLLKEGV